MRCPIKFCLTVLPLTLQLVSVPNTRQQSRSCSELLRCQLSVRRQAGTRSSKAERAAYHKALDQDPQIFVLFSSKTSSVCQRPWKPSSALAAALILLISIPSAVCCAPAKVDLQRLHSSINLPNSDYYSDSLSLTPKSRMPHMSQAPYLCFCAMAEWKLADTLQQTGSLGNNGEHLMHDCDVSWMQSGTFGRQTALVCTSASISCLPIRETLAKSWISLLTVVRR